MLSSLGPLVAVLENFKRLFGGCFRRSGYLEAPEPVKLLEEPKPVEPVEVLEDPKPLEQPFKFLDPLEPHEPLQLPEHLKSRDSPKPREPAKSLEPVKSVESLESFKSLEPAEEAEPSGLLNRPRPRPVKSSNLPERLERLERVQPTGPPEPLELHESPNEPLSPPEPHESSNEPREPAELHDPPNEPLKSLESPKSVKSLKSVESFKSLETVEHAESPQPREPPEFVEAFKPLEPAEHIEPPESREPPESLEAPKPLELLEPTEPPGPHSLPEILDPPKPLEPLKLLEPLEHLKYLETLDLLETVELPASPEPPESLEPPESPESPESPELHELLEFLDPLEPPEQSELRKLHSPSEPLGVPQPVALLKSLELPEFPKPPTLLEPYESPKLREISEPPEIPELSGTLEPPGSPESLASLESLEPVEPLEPLYSVLPHGWFRLALIQPSIDGEEEIECTLESYPLSEAPAYTTLSYAWGKPVDLCWITIDEHRIQIRPNLESALRRFRSPEKPFYLWVDALCINQDWVEERNQQVAMMTRIFSGAQQTFSWLGESSPEDKGVLSFLRDLSSSFEQEKRRKFFVESTLYRYGNYNDVVYSICKLFSRPYWNRIWIVPEIAVSDRVVLHCGDESLDWDVISLITESHRDLAIKNLLKAGYTEDGADWNTTSVPWENLKQLLRTFQTMRHLVQKQQGELSYFMTGTLHMRATDPRDKIFALLGITNNHHNLVADYNQSLDEVFTRTTRFLIEKTNNLDQFRWLTGHNKAFLNNEYPSWVRDPRITLGVVDLFASNGTSSYSAAGVDGSGPKAQIQFEENGRTLCVNGVYISRIELIGNTLPTLKASPYNLEAILKSWRTMTASNPKLFGETKNLEVFWRTLLTDRGIEGYHRNNPSGGARLPRVLPPDWRLPPKSKRQVYKLLTAVAHHQHYAFGRRFFVTSQGLMGLAPRNAQAGDLVYVLYGAPVPFVLRKSGEDGGFKIIGDCYTHGIMDGEAITGAKKGKYEFQRVKIC